MFPQKTLATEKNNNFDDKNFKIISVSCNYKFNLVCFIGVHTLFRGVASMSKLQSIRHPWDPYAISGSKSQFIPTLMLNCLHVSTRSEFVINEGIVWVEPSCPISFCLFSCKLQENCSVYHSVGSVNWSSSGDEPKYSGIKYQNTLGLRANVESH